MNELVIIAGFIASVTAAIYAGLAYHFPRRPSARKIVSYLGELPQDAESLFNFLLTNSDKIIRLDVQIGLTRGAAPSNQRVWVKSHIGLDKISKIDVLEIEHEMDGSLFSAEFVIIGCVPNISYINARTVDLKPKEPLYRK